MKKGSLGHIHKFSLHVLVLPVVAINKKIQSTCCKWEQMKGPSKSLRLLLAKPACIFEFTVSVAFVLKFLFLLWVFGACII